MSETPKAGRELDALIAEKVMGWKLFEVGYCGTEDETPEQRRYAKALAKQGDNAVGTYAYIGGGKVIAYDNGFCDMFNPSTDIAAAWAVHRLMCDKLFSVRRRYFAALQRQAQLASGVAVAWPDVMVVLRDSFPKAICLAALAAAAPPEEVDG